MTLNWPWALVVGTLDFASHVFVLAVGPGMVRLEHIRAKWIPVRVKKIRQYNNLEQPIVDAVLSTDLVYLNLKIVTKAYLFNSHLLSNLYFRRNVWCYFQLHQYNGD